MDPTVLTYSEWHNGKAIGSIVTRPTCYELILRSTGLDRTFSFGKYGGDRNAARIACEKFRYQYCSENGLLKNEYRRVCEPSTGDTWADVRLTQEYIMQCDIEDLKLVDKQVFCVQKPRGSTSPYAAFSDSKNAKHYFHREITGFQMVDHIDGNPLNNRRSNLRETTPLLNNRNKRQSIRNKSGITGVLKHPNRNVVLATWPYPPGHQNIKRFSIKEHGADRAWELAIAFRRAKEIELNIVIRKRKSDPDLQEPPRKRQRTTL